MHMLRHTYATNLIANGIDFKTAPTILGHDVKVTMRIYSRVTDNIMKSAASKINAIFDEFLTISKKFLILQSLYRLFMISCYNDRKLYY